MERWARWIEARGELPAETCERVQEPTVLCVNRMSGDARPRASRWRLYVGSVALYEAGCRLGADGSATLQGAIESAQAREPWLCLLQIATAPQPNSARRLARRIAAVLSFWDALARLRYELAGRVTGTLDDLVKDAFVDAFLMWSVKVSTGVRESLLNLGRVLEKATEAEVRSNLVAYLVTRSEDVLPRATKLNERVIQTWVERLDAQQLELLSGGDARAISEFLEGVARAEKNQ